MRERAGDVPDEKFKEWQGAEKNLHGSSSRCYLCLDFKYESGLDFSPQNGREL